MVTKKFLFVCKASDSDSCYVSDSLYSPSEVQLAMSCLSLNDVVVLNIIPFELDLSKYEH